MQFFFTKFHVITDCQHCGEIVVLRNNHDIEVLSEMFDKHLSENKDCQNYYDSLPTLESLRGLTEKR